MIFSQYIYFSNSSTPFIIFFLFLSLSIFTQIKVSCDPEWRRLLVTEVKWFHTVPQYMQQKMDENRLRVNGHYKTS